MNTPPARATKKRPALVSVIPSPEDALAKDESILLLHNSCADQIESLQLMMDAAVLAVEQVQDKRLELLEEGPEVTASELFVTWMIQFGLEANIAGKLVSGVIKRVLSRRLAQKRLTEVVIKQLEKAQRSGRYKPFALPIGSKSGALRLLSTGEAALLRSQGVVVQEVQTLAAREIEVAKAELESMNRWTKALRALREQSDGGVDALIKATVATRSKGNQEIPPDRPGARDTPGVSVLDQVQQYVSAHRMAVRAEASHLEMLIRADVIPPDSFNAMQYLTPAPLVVDNRALTHTEAKDYLKRYFESIIWTLILKEKPLVGGHEERDWRVRIANLPDQVPEKLLKYFLRRFINPATGKPFDDIPAMTVPTTGQKLEQKGGALIQYMIKIGDEAEKGGVRLLVGEAGKPRDALPK
jgi:hypothetical protein